jgi:hypothetical protein
VTLAADLEELTPSLVTRLATHPRIDAAQLNYIQRHFR